MTSIPNAEPFVTTEDAAAFLNKPASWLYRRASGLGIPRYRIGNQYRYRLSELSDWAQLNRSVGYR